MKIVLIIDVQNLENRTIFEKHLKREGFIAIENEEFAYEGEAHTHMFNTRAFILEVVAKALSKTSCDACKIIFQIGENPLEGYIFDKNKNEFFETKV